MSNIQRTYHNKFKNLSFADAQSLDFGNKIKFLQYYNNISNEELLKNYSITKNTLNTYKNLKKAPFKHFKYFKRLADVLKVDHNFFLPK